jgi:hypothetical protein
MMSPWQKCLCESPQPPGTTGKQVIKKESIHKGTEKTIKTLLQASKGFLISVCK